MPFVIQSGSRQYLVDYGQKIIVNKINEKKDAIIDLDLVYAFGVSDGVKSVKAKVLKQQKGPKLRVVKYKSKSNYHRQYGPRQQETILEIIK
jgi:large subunit ribosomal protein L21